VGHAADGYPGIPGIGSATAARLLNRYGPIEEFLDTVLGTAKELALLRNLVRKVLGRVDSSEARSTCQ
jgi:5'-3' exonuclease